MTGRANWQSWVMRWNHGSKPVPSRAQISKRSAHGLGDEYIRSAFAGQLLRCLHERMEAAAETTSGDFLHGKPMGSEHGRIHEFTALVVRDQSDAPPLVGEATSQFGHRRGLSGAQKAADHDIPGRVQAARFNLGVQFVFVALRFPI